MRCLIAFVFCAILVGHAPHVRSQPLPDMAKAQALLDGGRAEEAWNLLSPHEDAHAGKPEFDYLLAVAALESGRPNLATFILERVLAVSPGHSAARLEMARSYFALRDLERAEREFNIVLKADPPPPIRTLVGSYLDRIRTLAGAPVTTLAGYIELMMGRDTNVNAASSVSSVFVPGFGTEFSPTGAFARQSDNVFAWAGGLEASRPIASGTSLFAGADLRQRTHRHVDTMDTRAIDARVGVLQRLSADDTLRFSIAHNFYELDYSAYRRAHTASLEWVRTFGERARLNVFTQDSRIRYLQDDVQSSSSDVLIFGIGGAYVLDPASATLLFGTAYVGDDDAVSGRADGDRSLVGAGVTVQRRLGEGLDGFASIGQTDSRYGQENAAFAVTRRDRQVEQVVGLSWRLADHWTLRPQVAYTRNRSNLALSHYSRTEASLTLRRTW
jgi:outer membrane protein